MLLMQTHNNRAIEMHNIGTFKIIYTIYIDAFKTLASLYNAKIEFTARANRKHIIIIKKLARIDTQNCISDMKNTHRQLLLQVC